MKLHPALTYDVLRRNRCVVAYHASENHSFEPKAFQPLHVGSIQQSLSLVKNMKRMYPHKIFYLYEVMVDLGKISHLFDEDPDKKVGCYRDCDTYAYVNRIEFPHGVQMGDNLSLSLTNPHRQLKSIKLVQTK